MSEINFYGPEKVVSNVDKEVTKEKPEQKVDDIKAQTKEISRTASECITNSAKASIHSYKGTDYPTPTEPPEPELGPDEPTGFPEEPTGLPEEPKMAPQLDLEDVQPFDTEETPHRDYPIKLDELTFEETLDEMDLLEEQELDGESIIEEIEKSTAEELTAKYEMPSTFDEFCALQEKITKDLLKARFPERYK